MRGYIYCIKENGNIVYVGSTVNFKKRSAEHMRMGQASNDKYVKKKQPIHRYMYEQGIDNFTIEIIDTVEVKDVKELRYVEASYIEKHNVIVKGLNVDNGLNIRPGKLNSNARKIICKNTNQIFDSVTEACEFYGFDASELASHLTRKRYTKGIGLRKVGEALFFEYLDREADNRQYSDKTLSKVKKMLKKRNSRKVYSEATNTLYNSALEASVDLGFGYSAFCQYMGGYRKMPSELDILKLRYVSDDEVQDSWTLKEVEVSKDIRDRVPKRNRFRKVENIDTGEVFDMIKHASEKYNIEATHITRVCKGKRKSAGGYRWKYVEAK